MKFITLGPESSNHVFVTRRYLAFHGLDARAQVELVHDFAVGAEAVLNGRADFMVQCAVHPATTATVARFRDGLYVIDTFIAPSQDLAVIVRRDAVPMPTLTVMRPTLDYIDATKWDTIEFVDTVAEVSQGLVDGRYAAGLGYLSVADKHPHLLRVTEFVGTVDDAWIVYGRSRVGAAGLVACQNGPAATVYRGMA